MRREATSAVPHPNRAMIEAHSLTLRCTLVWKSAFEPECKVSGTKYDSEMPCGQIDSQFISGVAVWCPEAHAKTTVLTMVNMDTGYVGVLIVSGKGPDNFTVRSTSSFVDKLRAAKTRLGYDTEPAMRQLAEKIATFRHPRTTILEPLNRAGAPKCWWSRKSTSEFSSYHTER